MSKIFVISGPSGSGKTTLLKNLLRHRQLKDRVIKSISLTTRPKRSGEKQGKDYFFISESEFSKRRRAKKILEWTRYLGYYYATPKGFVQSNLAEGKNLIICLDLKGALKIKRLYPHNTITIFIMPPSLGALGERIKKRCRNTSPREIQQRLGFAKQEILAAQQYDYCLTNRNLSATARQLKELILQELCNA